MSEQIPPLTNEQMVQVLDTLDRLRNSHAKPVPVEARARIFAFLDQPSEEAWDACYSILVTRTWNSLWCALRLSTDYPVSLKPLGPWPMVPTREQVMTGLAWAAEREREWA